MSRDRCHLCVRSVHNSPPYQPAVDVYADAFRYDPETNTWAELKDFDFPGYAWTATRVDDQHVMLNGRVPAISEIDKNVWLVDLDTLSKKPVGELMIQTCRLPRRQPERRGIAPVFTVHPRLDVRPIPRAGQSQ